jgi:hypothetical protein
VTTAYEEYPKMLYAADGKTHRVVHNADDEAVVREEMGISEDDPDAPMLDLKGAPARKAVGKAPARKAVE